MAFVYGMPVVADDAKLAILVERVLTLSAISCVLVGLNFLVNLQFSVDSSQSLQYTAIAALVPMCGYCGARLNNPKVMCLFSGCSGANALIRSVVIALCIQSYLQVTTAESLLAHRKLSGKSCQKAVDMKLMGKACTLGADICQNCFDLLMSYVKPLVIFTMIFMLPSCMIDVMNAYWGSRLFQQMTVGEVVIGPPVAAVRTVAVQPGVELTAVNAQSRTMEPNRDSLDSILSVSPVDAESRSGQAKKDSIPEYL